MKVILTGSSGFLGKNIYCELIKNNDIITISRTGASINIDLTKEQPELPKVDLVIHAAGKAHLIPKSMEEKQAFFDVNLNGTYNLLEGLVKSAGLPKAFVFISTVAVYGCNSGLMINEDNLLKATDPYGQSKILAEKLVQDWCVNNNVICTVLRLPLLVGEDPPGNLGAMIKGIKRGYYFNIAGGKSKKSMVLVKDVAKIIPIAAKKGGVYNLTDGYHPSFNELSSMLAKQLGKAKPLNLPLWLAKIIARVGNLMGNQAPLNIKKLERMNADLTFDDTNAKKRLNWTPNPVLKGFEVR